MKMGSAALTVQVVHEKRRSERPDCGEDFDDMVLDMGRAAYAVVAKAGGAVIEEIPQ